MKSPIEQKYGHLKQFVNWKLETRKGKATKLPYQVNGKLASSTDPATWSTYQEAAAKSKNIGIVLTGALLCVDLDHVLKDGKLENPKLQKFIDEANTFTEISQSGEGLHVFFALTEPLTLTVNKKAPAEAYVSGRYIATTGVSFGTTLPVRTIDAQEAHELLELAGLRQTDPFSKVNEATTHLDPIPDDVLLQKIFGASNGAAIRALYDGDTSAYKKDASSADLALCNHLAFWCGRNAEQMERIWLSSPLAKRAKTKQRADYRARTIAAAISHCDEVYTPSTIAAEADDLGLLSVGKGDKKKYPLNTENICRILRNHAEYKGTLRFDSFRSAAERRADGAWRALTDVDAIDVQTRISILFPQFVMLGKNMAWDALMKVTEENKYDSASDFLKSLTWDGTKRLDSWLSSTYHTPDDKLHRSIGSNWIKGLVKRIVEPGCKFDYVLVLEGPQGIGKSTSLGVLAGSLGHVETTMSTDNKDFFMQFLGNSIVEFSEGETLSRTEVKRMKALITVQIDKYRPPYGRVVTENPRRSVFAMTTNQEEYLKDESGNRRWLPVAVIGNADIAWLKENRDQLLAEAYYRVVSLHETTYEFPQEEIERAQQERRVHNPNGERIVDWYFNQLGVSGREEGITAEQVFQYAFNSGFSGRGITHAEEINITDVLKTLLHLTKKRVMIHSVQANRWFPSARTMEIVEPAVAQMEL